MRQIFVVSAFMLAVNLALAMDGLDPNLLAYTQKIFKDWSCRINNGSMYDGLEDLVLMTELKTKWKDPKHKIGPSEVRSLQELELVGPNGDISVPMRRVLTKIYSEEKSKRA